MLYNLWFEITNLNYEVVKRLGAIEFDQLNLITGFRKFSFIIKLTGTFRCVYVCVCPVLYGAYNYNCLGLVRQVSKFISSVSVRGVIIVSRI